MVRTKYLPGFRLPHSRGSELKTRHEVEARSEIEGSNKDSATVDAHALNAKEGSASAEKDGDKMARKGRPKTKAKTKGKGKGKGKHRRKARKSAGEKLMKTLKTAEQVAWYRTQLVNLYSECAPTKLKDVDRLLGNRTHQFTFLVSIAWFLLLPLEYYAGQEEYLLSTAQEKYKSNMDVDDEC